MSERRQRTSRFLPCPRQESNRRSEGKVAAEIAALDRRVTALETQGTKRAPRPPFPCRPRERSA
jgi:hypothetical protein